MESMQETKNSSLEKSRKRWTPLPDEEFEGLSQEHKEKIREFEKFRIDLEFAALSDIIRNCNDKYQFAKTYNVLRKDKELTLANLTTDKSEFPPEAIDVMVKVFTTIIDRKLDDMAMWFWVRWSDPDPPGPIIVGSANYNYRQLGPVGQGEWLIKKYSNVGCLLGMLVFLLPWATALAGYVGCDLW